MDIAALAIALVLLFAVLSVQSGLTRAERRVARLERKLDLLLGHLGVRQETPRREEIAGLLREGKKVQAIKVYREATGAGLVEAKEAVEELERQG
ncbi:hypothetical protein HCJ93_27220 [Streptomyces sp. SBST2-5]|uniref:Large ribosomal subunit protein bL12 C-terminal domain-containing protein n=1 Tax=Streptomyces composti TaxID=2720025 RepID=A0ABX1AFA5_9ACTN|nr:ribosomal protein L7/L12 [Streptomyces composti]NJP53657.1 hypothetical protein [Streptomyces composti]